MQKLGSSDRIIWSDSTYKSMRSDTKKNFYGQTWNRSLRVVRQVKIPSFVDEFGAK